MMAKSMMMMIKIIPTSLNGDRYADYDGDEVTMMMVIIMVRVMMVMMMMMIMIMIIVMMIMIMMMTKLNFPQTACWPCPPNTTTDSPGGDP